MKKSTRNLLLGLGAVTVIGGIVYATKEEPSAAATKKVARKPARVAKPTWNESLRDRATTKAADIYVQLGEPPPTPELWVQMTRSVAASFFPDWDWPSSVDQEAEFLNSKDAGVKTWQQIKAIVQDVSGYGGAGIS